MAEPGFKTCATCGVYGAHNKNKSRNDGLATPCKACIRRYYKANKERLCARSKAHHEANKERRNARSKAYHEANKERVKAQRKTYYEANKERFIAYNTKYTNERWKTDEGFRLGQLCRNRVWKALKGGVGVKSAATMKLVGCTGDQLRIYLESNMSDELRTVDRSDLHVDHIVPCSIFDLSREDHQRACFHYTNLQYLHKNDNMRKHASLPPDFDFDAWFVERSRRIDAAS